MKEIVFLMPNVPYDKGYFEIATRMNTGTLRTGKSRVIDVKS